jgi:hypothetical protein
MPYDQILDSEVDPGSPITTGLIERLRDNPYALASSVDTSGGVGVITPAGRMASVNPLVPSMFDAQGAGYPFGNQYVLPLSGALVGTASNIVACPRSPSLCYKGVLWVPCDLHNNALNVSANLDPFLCLSGKYSGGVPTHLRVRTRLRIPLNTNPYPNLPVGATLTGPLSTPGGILDVPVGGGFVTGYTFNFASGPTTMIMDLSATVDMDLFYLNVRFTRNVSGYSSASVLWTQVQAGSIYTGTPYRAQAIIGS